MKRCVQRAFTLIEMMITVIIIGILAVLAVVAYRRVILSSHVSEATNTVQSIRAAQESYHSETLTYANISSLDTSFYPSATPTGNFVTAWGGPCSNCVNNTTGWTVLPLHVDGPVMFGYATVAGPPGGSPAPPTNITVNGSKLVFPATPVTDWYVVSANCDLDGAGGATTSVYTSSWNNAVWVDNEGQ